MVLELLGSDLRRIKWRSSVRGGFLSEVRTVSNDVQWLCLEHAVGDMAFCVGRGRVVVCVKVCTWTSSSEVVK